MLSSLILPGLMVVICTASAVAALLLIGFLDKSGPRRVRHELVPENAVEPTVFLFSDATLIDATGPARRLLEKLCRHGGEWDSLLAYLGPKLPNAAAALDSLSESGQILLTSESEPDFCLFAEHLGSAIRLTLTDMTCEGHGIVIDALSLRAQEAEITDLRQILAAVPIPIWRANADEEIIWANEVYLKLAAEITGEEDLVWPLPKLMHGVQAAGTVRRVKLESDRVKSDVWFDRHVVASGAETLQFAIPSGATVKAEAALRDFLQTLTKTFAHLSVGLAIFDKNRQLGLFNPALTDLTTLGFEFLSGRPTLFSFLDHLREARILPEPKNYASWRQEMAELERAATSGLYEETWTLPSGQTFRVTGRPHPDGAVAFVFEDISAEMSLNRRYRAQIELGHSVLDTQQDALCVFSANGDLVMSNSSYADLWGTDPATSLSNLTVLDAIRSWQEQCKPTPIWGDIRDFVADLRDRADWDAELITKTGQRMNCTVRPLTGGATLVSFHVQRPEKPSCQSVRRVRHRSFAHGLH